jgi:hypothetical protein
VDHVPVFIGIDILCFFSIIKPSLSECRPILVKTSDISYFLVLRGQGTSTDHSGSERLRIIIVSTL